MFYITIWYCAASYKERHQSLPHTRTHTQTCTCSPKLNRCHTKPTSHRNFPIVKIENIRPNLASSNVHTHHFHFDSVFLTYGFLSPPTSPFLSISNLRTYNKLNLNIAAAEDTKGRQESQKQSCFEGQTKTQFLPVRWAGVSQGCEPSVGAVPWSDTRPGWEEQGSDAHLSPGQLLPADRLI